ncbi:MAG: FmdE family protein [Pseudomonadota bacterium]
MNPLETFDKLLAESVSSHGHLCVGQVIGVRMAMLGCRLVDIDAPKALSNRKKLMVFIEIDRCITDAIQSVTGCQLGKRTLKFRDYGINAATFLNLQTTTAFRIVSTEESRNLVVQYAPEETDVTRQELIGYQRMPEEALFRIQPVEVHVDGWEIPGPPRRKVVCRLCGQVIRDGKEFIRNKKVICRPCAGKAYFIPCVSNKPGSR